MKIYDRGAFLQLEALESPPEVRAMNEAELPLINPETIGEHRVISVETGVIAHAVFWADSSKRELIVQVKKAELERWDLTPEAFKTRLDEMMITEVTLDVI